MSVDNIEKLYKYFDILESAKDKIDQVRYPLFYLYIGVAKIETYTCFFPK